MPRTIVTGGAGFLGSHICEYLLKKGHEVIAMDNLLTGTIANIEHLQCERFKFIKHDVTEYLYCAGKIDYVLHFASPASPKDYMELPIQTLKVGALGTHKALGLALEKQATFLLASTSEVYGDPQVHPQQEDYWGHVNPVGPRGVYDEAKRFGEAITMAYHRYHGLDTKIVRIFNTYGPRMRPKDGRAIPAFIPQALKNLP
ncbi:MAG: NAD-dependent epimerase/dehydratase family protein, partial [bacterium]